MKTALSIAGFDPTSGAGITADIKVFRSLNVYGLGVVSSITAQNTLGVRHIESLSRSLVKKQLDTLLEDIRPHASKIGMIYEKGLIKLICGEIERGRLRQVVLDPVILSSTGRMLIKRDALNMLVKSLLPLCRVVTPNMHEASAIAGTDVRDMEGMVRAAERIYSLGAEYVIVKGGHLEDSAVDILFDGQRVYRFRTAKRGGWFHGTGCAFSAAVAAGMAKGYAIHEAVRRAKTFMKRALDRGINAGSGMTLLGV